MRAHGLFTNNRLHGLPTWTAYKELPTKSCLTWTAYIELPTWTGYKEHVCFQRECES